MLSFDSKHFMQIIPGHGSPMRLPILIDTDMAFDDWMALSYLLSHSGLDVRAITIAATGETHAGFGVQNALRLLALTDNDSTLVAAGRTRPLRGNHVFPWLVRLIMDLRLGLALPRPRSNSASATAVALLVDQLRRTTQPITVVALGPLTNLAEALLVDPSLVEQIRMVYFMGGALDVPGNLVELNRRLTNRHAEWNVYIDPYAAAVVLQSGVPLTLVPLDLTNQYRLTEEFFQRCAACRVTPAADFIYRLLRRLQPLWRKLPFYFWDPLTAVIATHPAIAQFEERCLKVIEIEGDECGRLVVSPQGNAVRVCMRVDQAAFEAIFLETLNTPPAVGVG